MGKADRYGKGAPFLVELIAVLLFFALSATVILSLFAKASLRSREAERLSAATTLAAGAAELVRVADDPAAAFLAQYGGEGDNGFYQAEANGFFREDGAEYALTLALANESHIVNMRIAVLRDGVEIAVLDDVARYGEGAAQ